MTSILVSSERRGWLRNCRRKCSPFSCLPQNSNHENMKRDGIEVGSEYYKYYYIFGQMLA